jgi:hypothetical protein
MSKYEIKPEMLNQQETFDEYTNETWFTELIERTEFYDQISIIKREDCQTRMTDLLERNFEKRRSRMNR